MVAERVEGHASVRPPDPRYELLERVGSVLRIGTSAEVVSWRAHDTLLQRQVRLDVHRPGGGAADRFVANALQAATVAHPALARVLDVVNDAEQAYVVSAWVEGTSLVDMLADGPLDPPAAAALVGALADGVAAAHAAGTVVGVLGPEQVVRTASETVTLVRVPLPGPTRDDDIRGIGALLYAALTARWPLDGGGGGLRAAPTPGGRLGTPRHLRAAVPADLSALAMRALYPDRADADNEVTAAEIAQALGTVATAPELVPFGERAPADPTRASRRRTRLMQVGVPVLALVALGLVAWLVAGVVSAGAHHANGDRTGHAAIGVPSSRAGTQHPSRPGGHAPIGAAALVRPSAVTSFNPFNTPPGDDNADEVALADDGNQQTVWQTDPYFKRPAFGGLKPGTGLLFDLGTATTVHQIRIATPTPGLTVQIRAGDATGGALDSYRTVATKAGVATGTTIRVEGNQPARYWLVWLTSLPSTPEGNFQGAIAEVSFLR